MQPIDGPVSMRMGATAIHELYLSFMEAGFNQEQAFEMTKLMTFQGRAS